MISSLQNNTVKAILKLSKSSERKFQKMFLIEGSREISIAQQFHFSVLKFFICPEFYIEDLNYPIDFRNEIELIEVASEIYNKLSYRNDAQGIIAVAKTKFLNLEDYYPSQNALVLVIESIEKPGNIGALFRSADAAGVEAVIVCSQTTDMYNPNVIRSSMGCVFAVPFFESSGNEGVEFLKRNNFKMLAASLQTDNNFYSEDLKDRIALIFGSESKGLSEYWYGISTPVKLPMNGKIDSLNVSASCAAMLFEAVRQRQK